MESDVDPEAHNGAVAMNRLRWKRVKQEGKPAGKHFGRPRVYPQCIRYKAHRFRDNRCPCGYVREAR